MKYYKLLHIYTRIVNFTSYKPVIQNLKISELNSVVSNSKSFRNPLFCI